MTAIAPTVGDVTTVQFPFVRSTYSEWDEEGPYECPSWKPGVEFVDVYGRGDVESHAHGIGSMTLTVVSVHKPGRFPTRVFFTRKFITPEGKEFGKGKLHIATVEKFRRLASGYQYDYQLKPAEPSAREGEK